ncbi:MAG: hypothetical protein JSS02_08770 [Planctomycetes bacterium]|nr:hypothetical protein [Planctomycetota bacterium]
MNWRFSLLVTVVHNSRYLMTLTLTSIPSDRPLELPWSRDHVRAPGGNGAFVAKPELSEAASLAIRNQQSLGGHHFDVQGMAFDELRRWARQAVYGAAFDYSRQVTRGLTGSGVADLQERLRPEQVAALTFYVGGHQPTLFHPGVWVKNFVVGHLALRDHSIGLNLVVDTDTLSGTGLRVPHGSWEAPETMVVPFDAARQRQPWEEARILDRDLFATFARRVSQILEPSHAPGQGDFRLHPMLGEFWDAALAHSRSTDSLGECLTAARTCWERSWNLHNLELPVSRVCQLEPFLWFACHILAHLPRFIQVYNQVLREYRQVNRVRSRTHPVPDLRDSGGWLEAPFRVWRAGDTVRKRVFARQQGDEVQLSDGENVFAVLPLASDGSAAAAVAELRKLEERGIRFRTRALTTTLFARLFFADLFVHGIGGAKYDQMTDRITSRFFGLPAPGFLTLSATLMLPVPELPAQPVDEERLLRQLRELKYNSDRHLSTELQQTHAALIAEKQQLIAAQQQARRRPDVLGDLGASNTGWGFFAHEETRTGRESAGYARFRRLQDLNRHLSELTNGAREHIEEELQTTRKHLAANAVWRNREYSFCLFPADQLRRFMDYVCASTGG